MSNIQDLTPVQDLAPVQDQDQDQDQDLDQFLAQASVQDLETESYAITEKALLQHCKIFRLTPPEDDARPESKLAYDGECKVRLGNIKTSYLELLAQKKALKRRRQHHLATVEQECVEQYEINEALTAVSRDLHQAEAAVQDSWDHVTRMETQLTNAYAAKDSVMDSAKDSVMDSAIDSEPSLKAKVHESIDDVHRAYTSAGHAVTRLTELRERLSGLKRCRKISRAQLHEATALEIETKRVYRRVKSRVTMVRDCLPIECVMPLSK